MTLDQIYILCIDKDRLKSSRRIRATPDDLAARGYIPAIPDDGLGGSYVARLRRSQAREEERATRSAKRQRRRERRQKLIEQQCQRDGE